MKGAELTRPEGKRVSGLMQARDIDFVLSVRQLGSIRCVYDRSFTRGMLSDPCHLGLTLDGPLEVDYEAVEVFLHQ
jgi:hypothetical protein